MRSKSKRERHGVGQPSGPSKDGREPHRKQVDVQEGVPSHPLYSLDVVRRRGPKVSGVTSGPRPSRTPSTDTRPSTTSNPTPEALRDTRVSPDGPKESLLDTDRDGGWGGGSESPRPPDPVRIAVLFASSRRPLKESVLQFIGSAVPPDYDGLLQHSLWSTDLPLRPSVRPEAYQSLRLVKSRPGRRPGPRRRRKREVGGRGRREERLFGSCLGQWK